MFIRLGDEIWSGNRQQANQKREEIVELAKSYKKNKLQNEEKFRNL